MKKLLYPLSWVIALSGVIIFGILWCNNLVSAWRFHAQLWSGSPLNSGDLLSNVSGWLPQLNWSCVDVSTITTLIPFGGFLLILNGLCRPNSRAGWPFFYGYNRLNIALGLLGTIWGIILIGFLPTEKISIAALMHCLHTAMFSTLAAVAWVMVIIPVVITPWLNALRPQLKPLSNTEKTTDLWEQLQTATENLQQLDNSLQKFNSELQNSQKSLESWRTETAQEREAIAQWQATALQGISDLAQAANALKVQNAALIQQNRQLQERNTQLDSAYTAANHELNTLRTQLEAIERLVRK